MLQPDETHPAELHNCTRQALDYLRSFVRDAEAAGARPTFTNWYQVSFSSFLKLLNDIADHF